MARLKSAQFDDRMTLVEHLDELRTRIIVSAIVLVLAIAFCFWQNHALLEIANKPLPRDLDPLTFSPTEPFFTTVKLSIYGGILIALPILLYQIYAFVLPAFSPGEKRGGPADAADGPGPVHRRHRLRLLRGHAARRSTSCSSFNADQFNIEIRASEYYGFFILTLIGVGLLFQIPVGVLAVTRLGIVTPQQLAHNRRYAILIIAVVAMLLPGTDPVTMLISMAPLTCCSSSRCCSRASSALPRTPTRTRRSRAAAAATGVPLPSRPDDLRSQERQAPARGAGCLRLPRLRLLHQLRRLRDRLRRQRRDLRRARDRRRQQLGSDPSSTSRSRTPRTRSTANPRAATPTRT